MAGIWYRAGTVAVTNGSKKVVGTGTTWKSGTSKPDKGHPVHAPDGRIYELDYVESDTVLYLVTAYSGVTVSGAAYAIDITRTGTVPAFPGPPTLPSRSSARVARGFPQQAWICRACAFSSPQVSRSLPRFPYRPWR